MISSMRLLDRGTSTLMMDSHVLIVAVDFTEKGYRYAARV